MDEIKQACVDAVDGWLSEPGIDAEAIVVGVLETLIRLTPSSRTIDELIRIQGVD